MRRGYPKHRLTQHGPRRGAHRDGKCTETGLLQSWPEGGPPLVWKMTGIGEGYATVSVVGDRIFTCGDIGDSSYIHALDLGGEKLWSAKLGKPGKQGGFAGPRGTPTVVDGLVYSLGQFGDLVCVEAETGRERWRAHLPDDFGGRSGGWGYSESLLVDGERLPVLGLREAAR